MKGVMTVRSPRGTRRHGVRAWGDASGETLCGMRNRGWTLEPDQVPDCPKCQMVLTRRPRR